MIMAEMKKPRQTIVLGRGQIDPKDKVTAVLVLSSSHGAGLAHESARPRQVDRESW